MTTRASTPRTHTNGRFRSFLRRDSVPGTGVQIVTLTVTGDVAETHEVIFNGTRISSASDNDDDTAAGLLETALLAESEVTDNCDVTLVTNVITLTAIQHATLIGPTREFHVHAFGSGGGALTVAAYNNSHNIEAQEGGGEELAAPGFSGQNGVQIIDKLTIIGRDTVLNVADIETFFGLTRLTNGLQFLLRTTNGAVALRALFGGRVFRANSDLYAAGGKFIELPGTLESSAAFVFDLSHDPVILFSADNDDLSVVLHDNLAAIAELTFGIEGFHGTTHADARSLFNDVHR